MDMILKTLLFVIFVVIFITYHSVTSSFNTREANLKVEINKLRKLARLSKNNFNFELILKLIQIYIVFPRNLYNSYDKVFNRLKILYPEKILNENLSIIYLIIMNEIKPENQKKNPYNHKNWKHYYMPPPPDISMSG